MKAVSLDRALPDRGIDGEHRRMAGCAHHGGQTHRSRPCIGDRLLGVNQLYSGVK